MSGLINKVKEKVAELKGDSTTTGSTNAGPHNSNLANKADPRVDSDLDGRAGGLGHGNTTTGSGVTGTSGIGSSGANTTYTDTTSNTTTGPHSSNLANKLDPRVDSSATTGYSGSDSTYAGRTTTPGGFKTNSTTSTTGTSSYSNNGPNTTAGPHSSDMLNKLDPRVDSDLSGGHPGSNAAYTSTGSTGYSGNTSNTGYTENTGNTGYSGNTSNTGYTGSTGSTGMTGSSNTSGYLGSTANTTAGPHNSDLLNKMDPRVDSDLSGGHPGSNSTYTAAGTTGSTNIGNASNSGTNSGNVNSGPHSSNIANKLDPRVDSNANTGLNQNSGIGGSTTSGYGSSNSTNAGPHDSNLANKMDPRVDSDLDGSRNAGMNQTTNTGTTHHSHHGHHGHHGHNQATTGTDYNATNTGATGTGYNNTNEPVHNSSTLNKLDPRVDTSTTSYDNTTTSTHHGHHHGSHHAGTNPNAAATTADTTGPVHNSSILNKLDPRIDSNAANAGTAGTVGGSSTRVDASELDAAKHGPIAFKQVHGDPTVHHDFPEDTTSGRHGSLGRSDQHYGSGAA